MASIDRSIVQVVPLHRLNFTQPIDRTISQKTAQKHICFPATHELRVTVDLLFYMLAIYGWPQNMLHQQAKHVFNQNCNQTLVCMRSCVDWGFKFLNSTWFYLRLSRAGAGDFRRQLSMEHSLLDVPWEMLWSMFISNFQSMLQLTFVMCCWLLVRERILIICILLHVTLSIARVS